MQIIHQKYDKELLNQLPVEAFTGRIIVINNFADAKKAVRYLMHYPILGIDTETKPNFKKGRMNKVALLQVATYDTAFLFQLHLTGITDDIKRLLEDQQVMKVGLSLNDDTRALNARRKINPGNFVDLQKMVNEIGIEDLSLQKIYANLFGMKISKRKQLSNWNAETLDEAQKRYAALDAVACLRIYDKIIELEQSGDYQIVEPLDS